MVSRGLTVRFVFMLLRTLEKSGGFLKKRKRSEFSVTVAGKTNTLYVTVVDKDEHAQRLLP